MNIAIDFDGTYEKEPELFHEIVDLIHSTGNRAFIITDRKRTRGQFVEEIVLQSPHIDASDIYFAGYGTKREVADKNNLNIDAWIDNKPESVIGL